MCSEAAEDDIILLQAHLNSGKLCKTFEKNLGEPAEINFVEPPLDPENPLKGAAKVKAERALAKKYRLYRKAVLKCELIPHSKAEWLVMSKDNAESRDPHLRYIYLTNGLASNEVDQINKFIRETVKYLRERKVTLAKQIALEKLSIDKLRDAIYSSTCYSLTTRC